MVLKQPVNPADSATPNIETALKLLIPLETISISTLPTPISIHICVHFCPVCDTATGWPRETPPPGRRAPSDPSQTASRPPRLPRNTDSRSLPAASRPAERPCPDC